MTQPYQGQRVGPEQYISSLILSAILVYQSFICMGVHVHQYAQILTLFFKARKDAWTSDLKWCNYVVCPAGRFVILQLKKVKFSVECTDVWNKVCKL